MKKGRRKKWRRWLLELAVVVLVVWGVQSWQARNLPRGAAPALAGRLLEGQPVNLEDYRGRPVLVHFWATWCPVCRLESGAIEAVARDWPVITVAMHSGTETEVARYLEARDLRFPVVVDPDGRIAARWGVRGVPVSFVVDGNGRIRAALVGYTTGVGLRLRLWWAEVSPR